MEERRRIPSSERVSCQYSNEVELIEKRQNIHLKLLNLSTTGIAFAPHVGLKDIRPNDCIEASLIIDEESVEIKLAVIYVSKDSVGCVVSSKENKFRSFISEFFKSEIMAMRLVKVDSSLLSKVPVGTPHWFRCQSGNELYFIEDSGGLISFNIRLFGREVQLLESGKISLGGEIESGYIESVQKFIETAPLDDNNIREKILEKIIQLSKK